MEVQVAASLPATSASLPADIMRHTQLPASPPIRMPPNSQSRDYGIRVLRRCAETSVREYVRLLELQQAKGHPGQVMTAVERVEDADDHLNERIRVQADIALDDLRALESKVSDLFEPSPRRQLRRWFRAGSLAFLMPVINETLRKCFPHLPAVVRHRLSPSWPGTILSSFKYVTRNLNSRLMALCVKLFGTTEGWAWKRLYLNPENVTQPHPEDRSNFSTISALNSTSNTTAVDLGHHMANSTFAPFCAISTVWATFVTFLFGNTTKTSTVISSVDLSNSGPTLDIESPLLPPSGQISPLNTVINEVVDSLQTYSAYLSTTLQLLAVVYLVGGEMHHSVAKTMSKRLKLVYAKVEKKGRDEEEKNLSEQDALRTLSGWQWDILLWGQ